MMTKLTEKTEVYCSFCGKSQNDVRQLIAGPQVFICDECTELCMSIVLNARAEKNELKLTVATSQDIVPQLKREINRDIDHLIDRLRTARIS